ncbi:MAG: lipoyl synthase [Saccharofermentanales bacterium]
MDKPKFKPKPQWLHVKSNTGDTNKAVMDLMKSLELHTVCEEAQCPNCGECFGRKTATFMILGRQCTRNCTFCTVSSGTPVCPDPMEPEHLAQAVESLGLRYVVITSVTRDDLPDGGAGHFAKVIREIKEKMKEETPAIEVLIPDFQGNIEALSYVVAAKPDVINHNIETVPRLYPEVRPQAVYDRSLDLLSNIKKLDPGMLTKSGMMLGLGETKDEVLSVFDALRAHSCDFLTIGQYLAPSSKHHPVIEYVTPDDFAWYKERALEAGFSYVASGPLVRSSYMAEQAWDSIHQI